MNLDIFSSNDPLATFNDCSNWREGNICHQLHCLRSHYIQFEGNFETTGIETVTQKGIASVRDELLLTNQERAGG